MRFYYDRENKRVHPNGAVSYYTPMPFAAIARVENCPCGDGVRRLVTATGYADTWFSVPASTRVKGKHVAGYIGFDSGADPHRKDGPHFHAYINRVNAHLIRIPQEFAEALEGKK